MIIGRLLLPVHALLHRLVRSWPRHDPPRQQPDRQVGQGEGHRQRGALRRLCWSRGLPPHHKVEATTHHSQELKINILISSKALCAQQKLSLSREDHTDRGLGGNLQPHHCGQPHPGVFRTSRLRREPGKRKVGRIIFRAMLKLMLRKSMDTWGKDTALKLQRHPSKVEPKSNKDRNRSTTPQQQETSLSNKTVVGNKSLK